MPSDFLHLYWLVLICNSRALPSSSSLLCSRHDLILNFRGNILFPPPFFYKLITVLVLADAELISLARSYRVVQKLSTYFASKSYLFFISFWRYA